MRDFIGSSDPTPHAPRHDTSFSALTACAVGYHMASFWEIRDPSALDYDTTRGYVCADSGAGPPSCFLSSWGFVRSGGDSSTSQNCSAWSTSNAAATGAVASLIGPLDLSAPSSPFGAWRTDRRGCNGLGTFVSTGVWCVED